MDDYIRRLGLEIRRRRRALDLTQAQLASALGVTRVHLSRVERGRCDASLNLISRLAAEFGVGLVELITLEAA